VRTSTQVLCNASNIGLRSDRVPHAGEIRSLLGEATRGLEGHPQVLACCSVESPHRLDTHRASPRPDRLEPPRGCLADEGPQGEEMLYFGIRALLPVPSVTSTAKLTCYYAVLQGEPLLRGPCVEEGI